MWWPIRLRVRRGGALTKSSFAAARAALLVAGAFQTGAALGQAVPVPPAVGVAPGTAPTRDQITPPPLPKPAPASRLKIDGGIERAPCPLADEAYKNIRVTIRAATFNGLKGASEEELRPLYADYLGQDRPVATICEIRDVVGTYLRSKGYLAAVQVPTQKIENGTVRFEVLYARVVAIRVRGNAGRTERLIATYLNKVTQDEVFNTRTAERYLLLARDLPGFDVRLALRPTGQGIGELYGDVTVVRTPLQADLNIQNLAARSTGRFGGQVRAEYNGLLGAGDRTTLGFYSTSDFSEQQIIQAGQDIRLGGEGLRIAGNFTYAWTHPDLRIDTANVRARTMFLTLEASYPFVRTQAANLRAAVGLDYVNQRVDFNGLPLTRDRLRVGYLRIDADAMQRVSAGVPAWRTAASLELRHGFDIFDATRGISPGGVPSSRFDGDPEATVIRLTDTTDLRVVRNVTFSITPRLQYAFDPLLSFEQYSTGNYTIGRGYDPGALIGDSGAGASAELRLDRVTPFKSRPLALQPFVFVDSAWVWLQGQPGSERLTSVGGGVRASYADRVRLDLTAAIPTRRVGLQAHRGDARFLMSLTTRLWPWGEN